MEASALTILFLRCEKLLNAITLYVLGNSLRSDTRCNDEVAPKREVSVEYHQRCIGQCVRAIIPPMNAQDIRNKYLEFYAKQQHAIIKRAPLILTDDPTTLFTGAGMQPMIPYLLGETHPQGKRRPACAPKTLTILAIIATRPSSRCSVTGAWAITLRKSRLRGCGHSSPRK